MISAVTLCFIVFLSCAVYWWLKHTYSYWRRRGVPYMEPTPFLGNTTATLTLRSSFGLHLSEIYSDSRMECEPVVGIYILNNPALIIRDLELIKTILIRDFNKFPNHYVSADPSGDPLDSNNLLFVNNPKWRMIRTRLSPVFTSGKIKQMYPLMLEIGKDLETHLAICRQKGDAFVMEVKEFCALFTTDVIATTAFGLRVNSLGDPNTEFRVEGRKMFQFTLRRGFDFFVAFFLPKWTTLLRTKIFTKSFAKLIRGNVGYLMRERERVGNTRNDLIDILVALKKQAVLEQNDDSLTLDTDFLVAQAAGFITAGYETSSGAMSFALYELAKQPALQQRLRNEIHDALVEGNGVVSYEQILSLEYLGMVTDEVLRLYPVLPFLDREYVIGEERMGYSLSPHCDYELPNGMPVFIPIFGIHRDPKYWPNPHQFDPERFSAENRTSQTPMTYLPFGTGPRNCIGSRIGLLMVKIGLVHIFKNHHVTTCDRTVKEMKFDPKAFSLLADGGVYLNIVYDGLYEKRYEL